MRVLFIQQDHMSPTGPVGEAFADVLHDQSPFPDGSVGVATVGVNARLTKDQCHIAFYIFSITAIFMQGSAVLKS